MIRKSLVALFVAILAQTAFAQGKPTTWQRVPPDQEYELMKELYHNLKRADKPRSFNVTLSKPGKLNPLEFATLNEPLIFINGHDDVQAGKANEIMKKLNGAAKVIVVGKAGPGVSALPKQKVYSDLRGKLAKNIGLQYGPALVTQNGSQLRIEEIAP